MHKLVKDFTNYIRRLIMLMAMLFACRVVEGRTDFNAVPTKLKQQVADIIINDFALPDIVPAEFGGTAEA
jgi:hypothetical protein